MGVERGRERLSLEVVDALAKAATGELEEAVGVIEDEIAIRGEFRGEPEEVGQLAETAGLTFLAIYSGYRQRKALKKQRREAAAIRVIGGRDGENE